MKRFMKVILFMVVIFSLSIAANASVPHLINYQGKVTDTSGNPLNGSYDLTFRIYDAETAGNMLWQETQTGVVVDKGLFGILLGSVTALNIPFDKAYFLEIKVGTEVMSPRQRMTSAGYALRAEVAESVSGFDPGMVGTKTVDETGLANGMIPYYDSVSGKVKWNTPNISPVFARVTGSNFQTSLTTLVDISGLSVALLANSVYEFEALLISGSTTNETKYGMRYSATGASIEGGMMACGSTFISSKISAFNTATAVSTNTVVVIKGIVITGANAGNLIGQVLNYNNGPAIVKVNSFLKVTKIS